MNPSEEQQRAAVHMWMLTWTMRLAERLRREDVRVVMESRSIPEGIDGRFQFPDEVHPETPLRIDVRDRPDWRPTRRMFVLAHEAGHYRAWRRGEALIGERAAERWGWEELRAVGVPDDPGLRRVWATFHCCDKCGGEVDDTGHCDWCAERSILDPANVSDEEVAAELRAEGGDPERIGREGAALAADLIAKRHEVLVQAARTGRTCSGCGVDRPVNAEAQGWHRGTAVGDGEILWTCPTCSRAERRAEVEGCGA